MAQRVEHRRAKVFQSPEELLGFCPSFAGVNKVRGIALTLLLGTISGMAGPYGLISGRPSKNLLKGVVCQKSGRIIF